ncbi:Putative NADP-dependent oxidoreductase YfmJ [bacterium YEK0313]|nr:Putative NADP-dependent oxidoreductase YfmJ [bacterium YEK0313]
MQNLVNRQVRLGARPADIPQAEHFVLAEAAVPDPGEGEIVVRNQFLSVEPAMRGWVSAVANYSAPVGLGEVMRAFASGEVIASRHRDFAVGDKVTGLFGWQDYAVVTPAAVTRKITETDLPLSLSLGVLGLNGVTAYFGLTEIGEPRAGDTVVVSTAAGAVGSAVGQIARIAGCRTVGIAGGAAKVAQCRDTFGFDAAIDYKATGDLGAAVAAACPRGVDVYFDNTAGRVSDAVLPHLAMRARVVICGTASVSSWETWPTGPRVERHLLVKRARMQGLLVFDYQARYGEAIARLATWVREGRLAYAEDILDGIEAAPDAIAGLYRGENRGKRLIRLHA